MNMVSDVSLVLQEVLHQEKSLTETLPGISEPTENVSNMVQNTQQQLMAQLQKMQTMLQAMQLQYAIVEYLTYQDFGGRGYQGGQKKIAGEEDVVLNVEEIGDMSMVARVPGI